MFLIALFLFSYCTEQYILFFFWHTEKKTEISSRSQNESQHHSDTQTTTEEDRDEDSKPESRKGGILSWNRAFIAFACLQVLSCVNRSDIGTRSRVREESDLTGSCGYDFDSNWINACQNGLWRGKYKNWGSYRSSMKFYLMWFLFYHTYFSFYDTQRRRQRFPVVLRTRASLTLTHKLRQKRTETRTVNLRT